MAVAGAGPSGLAAAWFLTQLGYTCDVFEACAEAGGILRWGIPLYRLPLAALRREIAQIEAHGVRIHTGRPVTADFLKDLEKSYRAVYLACGHAKTTALRVPGEEMDGVGDGLKFLEDVRNGKQPSVSGISAVIGGGNTAVDVARSIVRLGGEALILYRRRRQDMPAFGDEVQMALEEGVRLTELVAPARIEKDGGRCVVTLRQMKVTGEEGGRGRVEPDGDRTIEVVVDRLFKATGAEAAEGWHNPPAAGKGTLSLSHCALVTRDGRPALAWGGDLTNDIKSVVHAVASGKQAAIALDTLFREGPTPSCRNSTAAPSAAAHPSPWRSTWAGSAAAQPARGGLRGDQQGLLPLCPPDDAAPPRPRGACAVLHRNRPSRLGQHRHARGRALLQLRALQPVRQLPSLLSRSIRHSRSVGAGAAHQLRLLQGLRPLRGGVPRNAMTLEEEIR